jgi:hypothetical protein
MSKYKNSHFGMSADEMLNKFYPLVISQARRWNIDGRAIAGAITWEYEENKLGRWSDNFQVVLGDITNLGLGAGLGWGSIHSKVLKEMGVAGDLIDLRMNAETAIPYIAEIMCWHAEEFFKLSKGVWINDNPLALAYFFNTGKPKLLEVAAKKKKLVEAQPDVKTIQLVVTKEDMPKWISENLLRFLFFETTPLPPSGKYFRVTTDAIIPRIAKDFEVG